MLDKVHWNALGSTLAIDFFYELRPSDIQD